MALSFANNREYLAHVPLQTNAEIDPGSVNSCSWRNTRRWTSCIFWCFW